MTLFTGEESKTFILVSQMVVLAGVAEGKWRHGCAVLQATGGLWGEPGLLSAGAPQAKSAKSTC